MSGPGPESDERPTGAAAEEAAGEPARMADIQRERAAEERAAGEDAARGSGANRSVLGADSAQPAVKARWRLREAASDLGSREGRARMFDRGRRRSTVDTAEEARATGPAGGGVAPATGTTAATDPAAAGPGSPAAMGDPTAGAGRGLATTERNGHGRAGRDGQGRAGRDGRRRGGRRGDDGSREASMVPKADFRSYYGRPVLKPPVWKDDIAYYFFLGGLSAGSSLLGAGADLTGRPALRRGTRIGALVSLAGGTYYLIHDLGRPERFHHMLRVAKPTSPMSVGTWVLAAYGLPMGIAGMAELVPPALRGTLPGRLLHLLARPAGLAAAGLAPAVASYTAVLLSQTAVPSWHEAYEELPFVFTSSAAASAGGFGMLVAPPAEAGPARALAVYGAAVELAASRRMEHRMGPLAEPMHTGRAHRYLRLAQALTAGGALAGAVLGRRNRAAAVASGVALMAGGVCERLGLLHAGIQSTEDPKYVVGLQRQRIEQHGRTRVPD